MGKRGGRPLQSPWRHTSNVPRRIPAGNGRPEESAPLPAIPLLFSPVAHQTLTRKGYLCSKGQPATHGPPRMLDAVILSDVHLGSANCQARTLAELLDRIATGELPTARLILNGD